MEAPAVHTYWKRDALSDNSIDAAPAEDAMRKAKPVQEVGVFGTDEFGVAIRKVRRAITLLYCRM